MSLNEVELVADPEVRAGLVQQVIAMANGFVLSQAVYAVAKLDIATRLSTGARTVTDLAGDIGCDTDSLRRLLRALAGIGFFREDGHDRYGLKPLGTTLVAGAPEKIADMVLVWMETQYPAFMRLADGIYAGKPGAQMHYGRPYFEWLAEYPEQVARFTSGLSAFAEAVLNPALQDYQLPDGETVADIGGSDGILLSLLLRERPGMRGIVFDLPHVVGSAEAVLSRRGLADRVDVVGGDFFESVPSADTYLMKHIMHDWNDTECVKILSNIAAAAPVGARLVIIESVIPQGDVPHFSKNSDLNMLGMLSGKERTEAEFAVVLRAAGFTIDRVIPTKSPVSVIEATLSATGAQLR